MGLRKDRFTYPQAEGSLRRAHLEFYATEFACTSTLGKRGPRLLSGLLFQVGELRIDLLSNLQRAVASDVGSNNRQQDCLSIILTKYMRQTC